MSLCPAAKRAAVSGSSWLLVMVSTAAESSESMRLISEFWIAKTEAPPIETDTAVMIEAVAKISFV
jgi:hypothetical protein